MTKIQSFLKNYDIMLFDMDGVITSEQTYWTVAALTAFEFLQSDEYCGSVPFDRRAAYNRRSEIRDSVFSLDKTIGILKDKGVNSNWDLAYVVICLSLIQDTDDFDQIYASCRDLTGPILDEYDRLALLTANRIGRPISYCRRNGPFWKQIVALFQRWYLGCADIPGLIRQEQPLFPISVTRTILSALHENGKILGYGTGRPSVEILGPLTDWGLIDLFDKSRRITYDNILEDEALLRQNGKVTALTKPHPYMFLKGSFKSDYPVDRLLNHDFDDSILKRVLVVGDAGADILAAQAMGADFCAVLTGVTGQKARPYFVAQKATYILNSICDFLPDLQVIPTRAARDDKTE